MSFIPLNELTVGAVYRLQARNLNLGVWDGYGFIGIREKWGERFLDACEVPDRTAWAIEQIGVVPEGMDLRTHLGTECFACKEEVDFDAERGTTAAERWQHLSGRTDHLANPYARRNPALFQLLDDLEAQERR